MLKPAKCAGSINGGKILTMDQSLPCGAAVPGGDHSRSAERSDDTSRRMGHRHGREGRDVGTVRKPRPPKGGKERICEHTYALGGMEWAKVISRELIGGLDVLHSGYLNVKSIC